MNICTVLGHKFGEWVVSGTRAIHVCLRCGFVTGIERCSVNLHEWGKWADLHGTHLQERRCIHCNLAQNKRIEFVQ